MLKKIALLAFASFGLSIASASAALIEADLFAPGDGLLIRDTVNNREWVDLSITVNQSANTSLSIYSPFGFDIGTSDDVLQLFVAAGIPDILVGVGNPPSDPSTGGTTANRAPVQALLDLIEHSAPWTAFGGNQWAHGYTDYGSETNLVLSRFAAFDFDDIGRANVNSNGNSWSYDTVHSQIGTYLVRDISTPVPAPGALALLGLGLLGLGVRRRTA